jgi:YVTN family beta-propeller protein
MTRRSGLLGSTGSISLVGGAQHLTWRRCLAVGAVAFLIPIFEGPTQADAQGAGGSSKATNLVRFRLSSDARFQGERTGALELAPRGHSDALAPREQAGALGHSGAGPDSVRLTQVGSDAFAGAVDPATHTAYFANAGSNTVSVVNDATCSALVLTACGGIWPTVAVGNAPTDMVVDPGTDTVYVANQLDDTISVIDGARCNAEVTSGCSRTPPTMSVGPGPQSLAFDPATKTLYVTDLGPQGDGTGNTISVIDAATCNAADHAGCGQTPATIKVGSGPFDLDVNVSNDTVYVTNSGDNTVSVIDGATCNASVRTGCHQHPTMVTVGTGEFSEIAFDPASDSVYVAYGVEGLVSVIDGAKCNSTVQSGCGSSPAAVQLVAPGFGFAEDVAVDDANRTLYAVIQPCPCPGSAANAAPEHLVAMVNTATCNGTTAFGCKQRPVTAAAGGYPLSVLVDSPQRTVYIGIGSSTVALLDADGCNATHTERCPQALPTVAVGDSPVSVAVDQRTHTAYVSNVGSGTVSVVNTATCEADDTAGCRSIAPTISVGGQGTAGALAVNEATNTVYVANFVDGTVAVIDGRTCDATHHSGGGQQPPVVTVAPGPDGVAVDQATDTVYVASDGTDNPPTGDTVSVIDGQTCNASVTSGCSQTPPQVTLGGPNPTEPAVDEATDTVYVPITGANGRGDKVAVINGATCNATVTSGCGQIPHNIKVGAGAGGAAVDAATDTVYVSNFIAETVSVIDGSTCNGMVTSGCGQVPPTVTVGSKPTNMVVDQATGAVYVANLGYETASLGFTVSVLNGATCNAMQTAGCGDRLHTVEVGGNPLGVAVNDGTGTVYVTNSSDQTVSVFEVGE